MAIGVLPAGENTVFASLDTSGTFSSGKFGTVWQHVDYSTWNTIVVDSSTPGSVYFAGYGINKSVDGGQTWSAVSPPSDSVIAALAVDPSNSNTLLAGNATAWIYRSSDAGQHWTAVFRDTSAADIGTNFIHFDPARPGTIYAGFSKDGVWKSTNGGLFWSPVNEGLPMATSGTSLDRCPTGALLLGTDRGLYVRDDVDSRWVPAGGGFPTGGSVTAVRASSEVEGWVLAGTSSGLFESQNGGSTWLPTTNLDGIPISAIEADRRGGFLVGTRNGGIFAGSSAGIWARVNEGLFGGAVGAIAADPDGTTIDAFCDRLFRTRDRGESWVASSGVIADSISRLVVGPNALFALGQSGVYRSVDEGATWILVFNLSASSSYAVDLQASPSDPSVLYVLTNLGLFRSTDSGENWGATGPPLSPQFGPLPSGLLLDPKSSSILYVSDGVQGIFKSSDSGSTWTPIGSGLPNNDETYKSLAAIDPTDPSVLYAIAAGDGACPSAGALRTSATADDQMPSDLYRSTDGGASWSPVPEPPTAPPLVLLVNPLDSRDIYASSPGLCFFYAGDFFESDDGGATWLPLDRGLDRAKAFQMVLGDSGKTVYAASNHGVLRFDVAARFVELDPVSPPPAAPIGTRLH